MKRSPGSYSTDCPTRTLEGNDLESHKPSPSVASSTQVKLDPIAVGYCLTALFFWTVGPLFIKHLTGYVNAWTQNALRYSVACLVWLPMLIRAQHKGTLPPELWRRGLIAWLPNLCMQTAWALCFYYATPALIVLLTKTNILWIAGFSMLLFTDERALIRSRRFWLGLLLSLGGLAGVVLLRDDLTNGATPTGIVMALITAFFVGLYTITIRIAFRKIDSRQGFAVVAVYTTPSLWLIALFFGDLTNCANLGLWEWACVVLSGATAIGLGHVAYYAAIRRLGATLPALVILAQPFTILIGSHLLFGESLSAAQGLFGIVLLGGAACAILAQRDLKQGTKGKKQESRY